MNREREPKEPIADLLRQLNEFVQTLKRAITAQGYDNNRGWPLSGAEFSRAYTIVYEIATRCRWIEEPGPSFSERLYLRHQKYVASYANEELGNGFGNDQDNNKDTDRLALSMVYKFAATWKRFKVFNKGLKRVFIYLDRYHVRTHDLPTVEQSGLNAMLAALPEDLVNRLLLAVQHVMTTIDQNDIGDLEAVLECTEALQLTNRVDPRMIEDVTYDVLESSRKRVINGDQLAVVAQKSQEELISKTLPECGFKILARFYESINGQSVERLVQNPSFSSTLLFHINSAICLKDQAVHLQASKMMFHIVRQRTASLGELRRPILNILLQDAMDEDPSGDIAKTSLSALECFTFSKEHIGCLRILNVLCMARDQHHGMHSKFKGIPSELIRAMHEVLCPYAARFTS